MSYKRQERSTFLPGQRLLDPLSLLPPGVKFFPEPVGKPLLYTFRVIGIGRASSLPLTPPLFPFLVFRAADSASPQTAKDFWQIGPRTLPSSCRSRGRPLTVRRLSRCRFVGMWEISSCSATLIKTVLTCTRQGCKGVWLISRLSSSPPRP